ncbi:Crp/Fnr family transcriptional regulator [Pseudomonas sp. IT-194MI4]|uniref:hypothetical protein n=1 Tax=Pseudomonas sp. IT-194MI4 TaxID=3026443 RepID=UPI0039E198EC
MTTFVSFESCLRPKGAPEFLAFSLKKNERVKFFNRASLWRWASVEFDPLAVSLRLNEQVFTSTHEKFAIPVAYETNVSDCLVFFEKGINEDVRSEIISYGEKNGSCIEFIGRQFLDGRQVESVNYLNMLSYIVKRRDSLTNRNLDRGLRIVRDNARTVQDAIRALNLDFADRAAALFFEMVRRGSINVPDIKTTKIYGQMRFEIRGDAHEPR